MKDPWYAVILSYFLPGLGHCYGGRPARGAVFFCLYVACVGLAGYFIFAPATDYLIGLAGVLAAVCVFLVSLADAHRTVRRAAGPDRPGVGRDPWLAGFLTYVFPGFFLPGVGQIYGRKYVPGIVLLALAAGLGAVLLAQGTGILAASSVVMILIPPLHHLARAAGLWHAQWALSVPKKLFSARFLILIPLMLAEGGVMSGAFMWAPGNVLQVLRVRGSGMEPVLEDGDRVFVDRYFYPRREPARGDIILYRMAKGGTTLLARVVALPGEEVQVRDGKLQVKGEPVGGLVHPLPEGEWGSMNLPDDRYLLIADNVRLEPDSGLPPPVERRAILGQVYKRIFPVGRRCALDGLSPGD